MASSDRMPQQVTVGLTGASGFVYGLRLIECLLRADIHVGVIYSQAAQIVAKQEMDLTLPTRPKDAAAALATHFGVDGTKLAVYAREDWYAPMASGSNPADAMVICPCSMGTLAAVANGLADNLIERAADVALKERRQLILVPRETPLSLLHLENMTRLARAGALILPANPGFWHRPQSVDALVDYVVARILDHLRVPHRLLERWGDDSSSDA